MKYKVLLVATLVACGGGESAPGQPDASIGSDTTVVAFDGEHVYFGSENRRVVDVEVAFPPIEQRFDKVTMRFALRCPNARCDFWDRIGWLSLVQNPGADNEREIELSRFMTPYRVEAGWEVDVSELRALLAGPVTLRVFIDTWVGPGHAQGEGWLVDAAFDLRGGVPVPDPFQVIPLWAPHSVVYGDPATPINETVDLVLPEGVRAARLRSFVTGHGQGNAGNCAEFCAKNHHLSLDGAVVSREIWRDDCPETAVPNQSGTWEYPRAGWCPGAKVHPWLEDVSASLVGKATSTIAYTVDAYENTCRPDGPCTDCVASACEYDSGGHTPPRYYVSSLLVLYR